jgi:UDP-glucose 4-epimerase
MKVLVTGGAGYVGSVCCRQLLAQGHDVVVLDDLSTGQAEAIPDGCTFRRLDYGDRNGVRHLLSENKVEAVFHFAAKALIPESVLNPGTFFDVNVASGIAFLETLREFDIKRFVFSSSAAVYGNPQLVPIEEQHPKDPVNSYGETKLMFERILHWYASAYGWTVVVFRYFNASGATTDAGENHRPETHIIPLIFEAINGDRSHFDIYGDDYHTPDGTCIRDYVHVSDIAAAHLLALDLPAEAGMCAYNIGNGTGFSVREVIQAVEKVTGQSVNVQVASRRAGDPAVLCASPAKLKRELNWEPRHSDLDNIVRTAWDWKQACLRNNSAKSPVLQKVE